MKKLMTAKEGAWISKCSAAIIAIMAMTLMIILGGLTQHAYADGNVAKIGNTEYATIQAAVEAAGTDATEIKLIADAVESVSIPQGAKITLNLQGHKVTNVDASGKHTVSNFGVLTIKDDIGGGEIDNISDNAAAVINNIGAECTIHGTLTLNKSNDNSTGSLSWYTLANRGTMTVEGNVTVLNPGNFTSCVTNGHLDVQETDPEAKLTIYGGTFSGGKNTIKNDSHGVLLIEGGTITNTKEPAIMNWHKCTINDATIDAPAVFNLAKYNREWDHQTEAGETVINGGKFTSTHKSKNIFIQSSSSYNDGTSTVTINGGIFNGNIKGLEPAKVTITGTPDAPPDQWRCRSGLCRRR